MVLVASVPDLCILFTFFTDMKVMIDVKYRGSVICIVTQFVVNFRVIFWNFKILFSVEKCSYAFHKEYMVHYYVTRV